jgi:glycosyltransferase involved in cell wall biosynthesis
MRALELESEIEFVGPLFGQQKDKLWEKSDIFLFPSYTREGLPYALLESMAAGTVPITTQVGAQPEVVEDGVHGLFIPARNPHALFDAIIKLDDNRDLLLEISRQAILRVREGYTIDRMSAEFQKLYRSLSQDNSV